MKTRKNLLTFSLVLNMMLILSITGYLISRWESINQRLVRQCNCASIMMLGDSHIANGNWGDLLNRFDVIEIAQGGLTSAQVRFMFKSYGRNFDAEVCFIEAGGNDLHSGCYDRLKLVDNLQVIINGLKPRNIEPVLQSLIYRYDYPEFNQEIDTVNRLLKKWAKEQEIDFLDINGLINPTAGFSDNYHPDRLHLSKKGYRIWRDRLQEWLDQREKEE